MHHAVALLFDLVQPHRHTAALPRSLAVLPRVLQKRANTDTRTGGGTKGSSPARQTRHGRTASRLCVACNVRRTRPMCVQNVPGAVCLVCGGATFPRRTHIFGTSVVCSNMQRQRGRFVFNIVLLVTLSCESSLYRRIGCDECAFACCLAPNTCFIQGRLLAEVRRRCVN